MIRERQGSGMRLCFSAAVLIGFYAINALSPAMGQGGAQPPPQQGPSSGFAEHFDSGYFATTGVVRFQLIQGRLQLDSPRHRKGSQNQQTDQTFESITVTANRGIPSLHYVRQTPFQHLTLSVQHATHIRIQSWLPQTGERAELDQRQSGPISWSVKRGDLNDQYVGATLLHVRRSDPGGFDLHCGPLVQQLLRGRSLETICQETEALLMKQLANPDFQLIDRPQVMRNIENISAKKLSIRRSAEKQLIRWGTPIVPIVNAIPEGDLDAEQTDRLRFILQRLRSHDDDTPASLAELFINDRDYWSAMAPRMTDHQLAMANQHLGKIGLNQIKYGNNPIRRIASGNR